MAICEVCNIISTERMQRSAWSVEVSGRKKNVCRNCYKIAEKIGVKA